MSSKRSKSVTLKAFRVFTLGNGRRLRQGGREKGSRVRVCRSIGHEDGAVREGESFGRWNLYASQADRHTRDQK